MTQQIPFGRFLLVHLDHTLNPSRVAGLFHNLRDLPGVLTVSDLAGVSREGLDEMLLLTDEYSEALAEQKQAPPRVVQRGLLE